ncbi:carbon storage regulator CsrA [Fusibacter sp. 3D3]|uniref:carbon storage regulator CsrA n=1 Tax=Fusibacter sp. 3D3 TaxID=1048380 RepID=UPI000852AFC8|nr:carbon storage regulator CsrA [Fusibacter sp. 3D3]GAU75665.1 carbon storage regulator [Fusibacter sp. 3D3]
MLILSRKKDESLIINGNIEIKIISSEDGKVKLGIEAPKEVEIYRKEVFEKIQAENRMAKEAPAQLKALSDLIKNKSAE